MTHLSAENISCAHSIPNEWARGKVIALWHYLDVWKLLKRLQRHASIPNIPPQPFKQETTLKDQCPH